MKLKVSRLNSVLSQYRLKENRVVLSRNVAMLVENSDGTSFGCGKNSRPR